MKTFKKFLKRTGWITIAFGFSLIMATNGQSTQGQYSGEDSATKGGKKEENKIGKQSMKTLQKDYGKIPLYFIENEGQMDKKVKFYEKGHRHTTFFTNDGIYLNLVHDLDSKELDPAKHDSENVLIKLGFFGAKKEIEILGKGLQEYKVNYFIGKDPKSWKTNVPTYSSVIYNEVYPGIDIKFYGNNKKFEYDVILEPGADPSKVKLFYEGVEGLRISEGGDLEINLQKGTLIQKKPYIYQEIDGEKVEVEGRFKVQESKPTIQSAKLPIQFAYSFDIGEYNQSYPLIIDPSLEYSTFLGGSAGDDGHAVAVDSAGNAYYTGDTRSDFLPPIGTPFQPTRASGTDVYVFKVNPAGTSLLWSTYLGGGGEEVPRDLAVDGSENVYVTGLTLSNNFPTASAFQGARAGNRDAFVTRLNASGSTLDFSTYLGGEFRDEGLGIAVDSSGDVYVTGRTDSSETDTPAFPLQAALDGTYAGGTDAFVTQFDSSGTFLVYSTYLGGAGFDEGRGIAVDGSSNTFVSGLTDSDNATLPTEGTPFQSDNNGLTDVFAAKLAPLGASWDYLTYLGGAGDEIGAGDQTTGMAIDSAGNAFITGQTASTDFPTAFPIYTNLPGDDAFLTKLNVSGSGLVYSTYLGGDGADHGVSVAVDSAGIAYVTGQTDSTDFPEVVPPAQSGFGGGVSDAFVSAVAPDGLSLIYSTYLGGTDEDSGVDIAADSEGGAYIIGATFSTDFLTVAPPIATPIQGTIGGMDDMFVSKIGPPGADLSITKSGLPDPVLVGNNLTYTIDVSNAGPEGATNLIVTDTLPANVTFVSATGTGWVCNEAAGVVTCTRPSLAVGAAPSITIVVTPNAGSEGVITNMVSVESDESDPDSGNDSAMEDTTVNANADIEAVSKTDSPDPVIVGNNLTYTITVRNNGPSDSNGVTVVDTLPADVTFVSATPSQGGCVEASLVVTCTLGTLANGATATIMIVVTPNPAAVGTITNNVTATGDDNDPTPGNNSASEDTTVNAVPAVPIGGMAFSNAGGSMSSGSYALTPGVGGQGIGGNMGSASYTAEIGFAPGVDGS